LGSPVPVKVNVIFHRASPGAELVLADRQGDEKDRAGCSRMLRYKAPPSTSSR